MIIHEFDLDMIPDNAITTVKVNQYDDDFNLKINLFSRKGGLTIQAGTEVIIRGKKPDGHVFSADCSINGNVVTVVGNQQMTAAAGRAIFELSLRKNGKELNSANFIMKVERAPMDKDTPPSNSVIRELVDALDHTDEILEAAESVEEWLSTIDDTLSQPNKAADAKKTGDEIADLKSAHDNLMQRGNPGQILTRGSEKEQYEVKQSVSWTQGNATIGYTATGDEYLFVWTKADSASNTPYTTEPQGMTITFSGHGQTRTYQISDFNISPYNVLVDSTKEPYLVEQNARRLYAITNGNHPIKKQISTNVYENTGLYPIPVPEFTQTITISANPSTQYIGANISKLNYELLWSKGSGLSEALKISLARIIKIINYTDPEVSADALILLTSLFGDGEQLTVLYNQSGPVYVDDAIDVIRQDLTITKDETNITYYTLIGNFKVGVNAILVTYYGCFSVITVDVADKRNCYKNTWTNNDSDLLLLTKVNHSSNLDGSISVNSPRNYRSSVFAKNGSFGVDIGDGTMGYVIPVALNAKSIILTWSDTSIAMAMYLYKYNEYNGVLANIYNSSWQTTGNITFEFEDSRNMYFSILSRENTIPNFTVTFGF